MNTDDRRDDDEDPWMFFEGYSKTEIDGATQLLKEAGIVFKVKEGAFDPKSGWTGPFDLWVHDEYVAQATSLLVPYFESHRKGKA